MEYILMECCEKMIILLTTLKENGSITQEEFNNQIKVKQLFINKYSIKTYA